jgi:hypothetical protein
MLALLQTVQPTLAQQLIDAAAPILATILVAVLTLVANALKAKLQNESSLDALNKLAHLAEVAVLSLEQTMVARLKELASDGRLTKEELAQVKDAALLQVRSALSKQGLERVMKALGYQKQEDLDALLSAQIEAAVSRAKSTLGRKIEATIEDKTEPGVTAAAVVVPAADALRREGSGF